MEILSRGPLNLPEMTTPPAQTLCKRGRAARFLFEPEISRRRFFVRDVRALGARGVDGRLFRPGLGRSITLLRTAAAIRNRCRRLFRAPGLPLFSFRSEGAFGSGIVQHGSRVRGWLLPPSDTTYMSIGPPFRGMGCDPESPARAKRDSWGHHREEGQAFLWGFPARSRQRTRNSMTEITSLVKGIPTELRKNGYKKAFYPPISSFALNLHPIAKSRHKALNC